MVYEVLVDWTAENCQPGLSVMYFDESGIAIGTARTAIDQLYTDVAARLDSLTTWTVRTSGKILDNTTGTLTGFWSDATAATGTGTLSGIPVPNASQVLLRWRTTSIINGRLLQGRTYVPGLGTGSLDGGQLSSAAQTAFQTAQATFLATVAPDFVIWHRPNGSDPGTIRNVESGATWNELATQRRRR